jgi:hypothetical protein
MARRRRDFVQTMPEVPNSKRLARARALDAAQPALASPAATTTEPDTSTDPQVPAPSPTVATDE